MNLKGVMLAALAISLAAPRAWADPVMDGFSAAEGFLMDSAGQSIAQINPSACAADSASPSETSEQILAACRAARGQSASKKRNSQSSRTDQQSAANPLQNASALGDALGSAVSGLSTPSQPDSSAKAASKKTKRLTMVAHAAPEKSPGSSAQYGPAGLNRSVPAAFQTAKQLAGGLGQQ